MRKLALLNDRVYVTEHARICRAHYEHGGPFQGYQCEYTSEQIEDMVDLFRESHRKAAIGIKTAEFKKYLGISAEDFHDLLSALPSLSEAFNYDVAKSTLALQAFLNRMRTGHTYADIAHLFGVSKDTLRKYIKNARSSLLADYVPTVMGFDNITREQLLANQSVMARRLHAPDPTQAVIIADGTYIFCHKSKNYKLQRDTYNTQKGRNFTKPMVFVTTNGLYVDIMGPFPATQNDASIMQTIFEKSEASIMGKLLPGDVFLLDRGFRDCIGLLEERGFNVKMPAFIEKSDKTSQLTAKKANDSRLVTANRFVIESRNGHMKTIWNVFSNTWCTYDLPHMMDDYKIGAALINQFHSKIESNKTDADQIARDMLARQSDENLFAKIIKSTGFQNHVKYFIIVSLDTLDLPIIEKDDFKKISLGNYQISQTQSYCIEAIERQNGQIVVYACPDTITESVFQRVIEEKDIQRPIVLRATMHSRFSKSKKYIVYVLIDKRREGSESIMEYCCECRHGLRKVGCCGHVMAFISYVSYYSRHPDEIKKVAPFMDNFFNY